MGVRILVAVLLITAIGSAQTIKSATAEPKAGTIRGTLVDKITGRVIGNATVIASGLHGEESAATVSTDRDGNFSAEVDPGTYTISAKKEGYVDGLYGSRFYSDPGIPISVTSGATANLTFPLLPGGVIAGTVQNEDGEGFANVNVRAMQYRYTAGGKKLLPVAQALTNDRGEYRLHGLRPGRYFVVCQTTKVRAITDSGKKLKGRYPLTFYPSVALFDSAANIVVTAGNEFVANITMMAARAYRISGKVAGNDPGKTVALSVLTKVATDEPVLEAKTDEFDHFQIDGVLPGEYRLVASSPVAGNPARAVKKITLEDSDLNDLVIAMPKPALPVDAFVQGSSQLYKLGFDKIHVVLQPAVGENEEDADISGANATREVSTDGHGFFRNLTPSRPAKVEFATVVGSSSEFVDWYVDSVYRNREDVTFTGFDPTSTGTLNILFSPNGGELNGKVSNDKGVAFPGATVLLYPEEQHMSRPDLYHAAKTDQNGEFSIHGIAPGTYRLLAWDWVEPGALYDPEFLRNFDNDAQTTRIEKGGEYDVMLILTPDAEEASGR